MATKKCFSRFTKNRSLPIIQKKHALERRAEHEHLSIGQLGGRSGGMLPREKILKIESLQWLEMQWKFCGCVMVWKINPPPPPPPFHQENKNLPPPKKCIVQSFKRDALSEFASNTKVCGQGFEKIAVLTGSVFNKAQTASRSRTIRQSCHHR